MTQQSKFPIQNGFYFIEIQRGVNMKLTYTDSTNYR